MSPNNFIDSLTFALAPPWGQHFSVLWEISPQLLDWLAWKLVQILMLPSRFIFLTMIAPYRFLFSSFNLPNGSNTLNTCKTDIQQSLACEHCHYEHVCMLMLACQCCLVKMGAREAITCWQVPIKTNTYTVFRYILQAPSQHWCFWCILHHTDPSSL